MIFEEFQNGILNRLAGDAYFSAANSILLKKEARRNIRKTVLDALTTRGIIGIVRLPHWNQTTERSSPDFLFETDIDFHESPLLVEDEDDGRTGFNCIAKGHALLSHHAVPVEFKGETTFPFSRLKILFGGFAEERDGISIYRLTISSVVNLETLNELVSDDFGNFLVTEENEPLTISPTSA